MERKNLYLCMLAALLSCSDSVKMSWTAEHMPNIFPDYAGVVIPPNIAPLNFALKDSADETRAVFSSGEQCFVVKGGKRGFVIPDTKWKKMLDAATGKSIQVTVQARRGGEWMAYAPFSIQVAPEKVDSYLAYRLIDPGYELWNKMGIYQRDLESHTQTPIIENKMSGNNCVNCHSFCMQNPDKMLFHMRETFPGTILVDGDKIEKLNTKTKKTISSLVYPSWHPSGKYVAFSVNTTKQAFHLNDKNRVEVYDEASDVVVYDVEKHEIVTASNIFSKDAFETFPTFSPDGKTLYFCTAEARPIPQEYSEVKYNLCSVSFDPKTRAFGTQVDTLYNAKSGGMSASFPRVSPDGRYLLYTLSGYGNFSIWHKDADLYMADLQTGTSRPLAEVNSDDVESYHSWSSNSRWFVFSSRRIDGLYTRPYIAYVGEDGKVGKPFLLPQKDAGFYQAFMKSFNIPEFITGKVKVKGRVLAIKAKEDKGTDVGFAQ
ncbi:hypothetical protein [uncultured Parabacteroides sp.]|uniref:TolB family protein n=1 Tax=uncultured Parabacteroides sp. TaxID=512312 RepID=UPI0026378804|nr:hypothetical protein [uncultured Parabacteroides sp.]